MDRLPSCLLATLQLCSSLVSGCYDKGLMWLRHEVGSLSQELPPHPATQPLKYIYSNDTWLPEWFRTQQWQVSSLLAICGTYWIAPHCSSYCASRFGVACQGC